MSTSSIIVLIFYIVFIGGGCAYTMYRTLKGKSSKEE